MTVILIGGPLDGELREVDDDVAVMWDNPHATNPWERRRYYVYNGVARHESVSEEEVAKRLSSYLKAAKLWLNDVSRWEADCNELAQEVAKSFGESNA